MGNNFNMTNQMVNKKTPVQHQGSSMASHAAQFYLKNIPTNLA
jgi:hypothetical protein